ncbi:MAG: hypothetical protein AAF081_19795, partial [Actinomycetota bacterium]
VTRSSSILLGALLGIAVHHRWSAARRYLTGPVGALASAASLAFLAWSWVTIDGSDDAGFFDGGFFVHAVAVCVIIGRVTLVDTGLVARVFSIGPLRVLGIVSYGLYLWHWPVIVIANLERTGTDGATLLAIRLTLMTVLTAASYVLIERPARHDWSRRRHAIWGLPVAAAVTAVLLVAGSRAPDAEAVVGVVPTTTTTTTAPAETTDDAAPATETDSDTVAPEPDGEATEEPSAEPPPLVVTATPPPVLAVPTADDPLSVLLVGDSYLFDAEPGIVAAFESVPEIEIRTGARFAFAATDDDALGVLADLRDEHEPDVVITMWARFDAAWLDDRDDTPAARDEIERRMTEAFDVLAADGAAVVVIGLAPSLGGGIDRVPVDRAINEVFLAATAGAIGPVVYLDPDPVVAPDGTPDRWLAVDGGELLVRKVDVSHYCGDGAARWGLALGELLAAMTSVPAADPADWWTGDWREDPRYDEPEGACAP